MIEFVYQNFAVWRVVFLYFGTFITIFSEVCFAKFWPLEANIEIILLKLYLVRAYFPDITIFHFMERLISHVFLPYLPAVYVRGDQQGVVPRHREINALVLNIELT